jgi:hypothetical protein
VLFERLPLVLGNPRLLLCHALNRLLLRAQIALALLLMGREQRFALLCETLFDSTL